MTILVGLAGGGGILEWLPVGLSMGDSRKDRPTGLRIFPSKGMSLLTRELPGEDSGRQNPSKLAFQQLAAPT